MIVIIINSDFLFLRSIDLPLDSNYVEYVSGFPETMKGDLRVYNGHPIAQAYAISAPWATDFPLEYFNRTEICPANSNCLKVNNEYARVHYSVGSPYIYTVHDLKKVVNNWVNFLPSVYNQFPYLNAEMYAYSMAAADADLPNISLTSMLLSNIKSKVEGWYYIDPYPNFAEDPINGIFFPDRKLTTFIRYNQNYSIGDYIFAKKKINIRMISCEYPMFKIPSKEEIYNETLYINTKNIVSYHII